MTSIDRAAMIENFLSEHPEKRNMKFQKNCDRKFGRVPRNLGLTPEDLSKKAKKVREGRKKYARENLRKYDSEMNWDSSRFCKILDKQDKEVLP